MCRCRFVASALVWLVASDHCRVRALCCPRCRAMNQSAQHMRHMQCASYSTYHNTIRSCDTCCATQNLRRTLHIMQHTLQAVQSTVHATNCNMHGNTHYKLQTKHYNMQKAWWAHTICIAQLKLLHQAFRFVDDGFWMLNSGIRILDSKHT